MSIFTRFFGKRDSDESLGKLVAGPTKDNSPAQNEELQRAQAGAEDAARRYGDLFDFAPVAYFLWDEQGRILEVNLAGAALLSLNRDAVIHKRFGQFAAVDHRVRFTDFCARVLATDTKQTCAVKIRNDGRAVDVLIEGIVTQERPGQKRLCRAAVVGIKPAMPTDESAALLASDADILPALVVFDPAVALSQCDDSQDMLREMIQCFFGEVDSLLPKMRTAQEKGDLEEVGRLGHRMKGTVVYLGAEPAREAALRVERFCKSEGGTPVEAGEAIDALEHECLALKAALNHHPLAAEPAQGNSH